MEIFSTASDAAERVTSLAWFMIIAGAVVFTGVMLTIMVAVRRNRQRSSDVDLTPRSNAWIIYGGALMPTAVLATIFVVSLSAMGRNGRDRPVTTIAVSGHQWWWEAEYVFADAGRRFVTANEIHIPVGRQVRLLLTTADVIHSFWVPQLQGKLDLIPGDTNDLRLMARRAGTYRGQCAEFCGAQHANMAIVVVADDSATFEQWAAAQLAESIAPADSQTALGQRLFVSGACALCHAVRGTPARATVGPDLTHVGSRSTIASGTLLNRLGEMEAWIANAQSLKPGTKMPTITTYNGRELRALAVYLESLK
jgi:cytochrome c oxidase subunit 2